jgi:hypothetical protein
MMVSSGDEVAAGMSFRGPCLANSRVQEVGHRILDRLSVVLRLAEADESLKLKEIRARIEAMELKTFEGTWEEVIRHGSELAGRKVRLTVLGDARPQTTLVSALHKIIEEAENLAAIRPPTSRPPSLTTGVRAWPKSSAAKGLTCDPL